MTSTVANGRPSSLEKDLDLFASVGSNSDSRKVSREHQCLTKPVWMLDDDLSYLVLNVADVLVLSLSQVTGSMPTSGSAGSVPENLNLFPEPEAKGRKWERSSSLKTPSSPCTVLKHLSCLRKVTDLRIELLNGSTLMQRGWSVLIADRERCGNVGDPS